MTKDELIELLDPRTHLNPNTGCFEYEGLNASGYGQVTIDKKFYYIHRLSANVFLGYDLDSDLVVMHTCDNRACWHPNHLLIGTIADNNLDMLMKGKSRGRFSDVTHCIHGHEFTEENTYWHRKRRQCRECKRVLDIERKKRLRGINK